MRRYVAKCGISNFVLGLSNELCVFKQHAGLRKCLLAIYLIVLVLFVVVLIVIATLAPIEQTFASVRTTLTN